MRKKRGGAHLFGLAVLGLVLGAVITVLIVRYAPLRRGGEEGPKPSARLIQPPLPPPLIKPPHPQDLTGRPELPAGETPRVAIVIDDMGQDMRKLMEILKVDAPITVAVLPYLLHSGDVARAAHSNGMEVLMHLPMEPQNSGAEEHDPGQGALLIAMDKADIRAMVEEDLKEVPFAAGINNHMGSRFTENTELMRVVLEVVKRRDLYFLDSRTTPASVGNRLAEEMGVRFAMRNVFLDNTRDEAYIKGQIMELASIARKRGKAVAIGHPYPETIKALKDSVSMLERQGIQVVRLSELLN
ncbi:MAG: divergent polysaccharide deacetylase family protein [Deltaproteobacteria bacterium]|nr:divergent polysaccharide deacetylase family protein [Deltaproteobacteria bacterium]